MATNIFCYHGLWTFGVFMVLYSALFHPWKHGTHNCLVFCCSGQHSVQDSWNPYEHRPAPLVFSSSHMLPFIKEISFFNSISTLYPFTPHHQYVSPPIQLRYLCCLLPAMNRDLARVSLQYFCTQFTLFLHSSSMEMSFLPIHSIITATQRSASHSKSNFSNSDFSARHLTLISIIWYLHLN